MQTFKQALEQAFNCQWALMGTCCNSVYCSGITMKTAGSDTRFKFISRQQLYIVP